MDNEKLTISYFAHEGIMARQERTIKRLWILCIILIALLFLSNGAWAYYESQFEDVVTVTQESTTDNGNAFTNYGGTMIYGEGETDSR